MKTYGYGLLLSLVLLSVPVSQMQAADGLFGEPRAAYALEAECEHLRPSSSSSSSVNNEQDAAADDAGDDVAEAFVTKEQVRTFKDRMVAYINEQDDEVKKTLGEALDRELRKLDTSLMQHCRGADQKYKENKAYIAAAALTIATYLLITHRESLGNGIENLADAVDSCVHNPLQFAQDMLAAGKAVLDQQIETVQQLPESFKENPVRASVKTAAIGTGLAVVGAGVWYCVSAMADGISAA